MSVHHVLKSRRVTETPSHKQRSKAVWNRQEKARRRTLEAQPVQTVQESPGKALVQGKHSLVQRIILGCRCVMSWCDLD